MNDTQTNNSETDSFNVRTLDNGVTVIHEKRTTPPVVTLKFFFRGGSSLDPDGQEGLARLTARTLIRHTQKKSMVEMNRYQSRYGLKVSSEIHPDFSLLSFTSIPEHRGKLFDLVREIFSTPSFDTDVIKHLKEQQKASLLNRKDKTFRFTFDKALEILYQDHPYGHPPQGNLDAIETLSADDMREFFRSNYSTKNLVVSAVGDVEFRAIKSLSSDLALTHNSPDWPSPDVTNLSDTRVTRKRTVDQPTHVLLFPAPDAKDDRYVPLKITDALLGGGMGSILFREMRDEQSLGYQVGSSFPSRRYQSTFRVYLGGGSNDGDVFRETFYDNLRRLADEGPDTKSLDKAKEYLKGNFLLDHETPGRVAWYRGFYEILGKEASFDETFPEQIDEVNSTDVKNSAEYLLNATPLHYTIVPE